MRPDHSGILVILVTVLVVAPLLYLRVRRNLRARPLRLDRLWIRPAIIVAAAALVFFQTPPRPGDWVWLAPALLIGAGLGWYWGKMTAIHVDPETRSLMGQGSPMAAIFLILLIVLRMGLRTGLSLEAKSWSISPALITDGFMIFALALYVTQTAEIFLRARKLLERAVPAR